MQIFIKDWSGKTFTIDCEPSNIVYEIGAKFEEKTGIKSCENIFIFCGKQLEYYRAISEYNIQKESTLHTSGTLKSSEKCYVIYDNQNKIVLDSGCPVCVKNKIEDIFGIKKECQELVLDGEIVNDKYHFNYLSNKTLTLKLKLPEYYKK